MCAPYQGGDLFVWKYLPKDWLTTFQLEVDHIPTGGALFGFETFGGMPFAFIVGGHSPGKCQGLEWSAKKSCCKSFCYVQERSRRRVRLASRRLAAGAAAILTPAATTRATAAVTAAATNAATSI